MSKVEWSDEARKNFRNTIRYIAYEFGKKAVRKFEANIAQWENLIAMNPAMGPKEPLLQHRHEPGNGTQRTLAAKLEARIPQRGSTQKLQAGLLCRRRYLYIADVWDTRREPRAQADNLE